MAASGSVAKSATPGVASVAGSAAGSVARSNNESVVGPAARAVVRSRSVNSPAYRSVVESETPGVEYVAGSAAEMAVELAAESVKDSAVGSHYTESQHLASHHSGSVAQTARGSSTTLK